MALIVSHTDYIPGWTETFIIRCEIGVAKEFKIDVTVTFTQSPHPCYNKL